MTHTGRRIALAAVVLGLGAPVAPGSAAAQDVTDPVWAKPDHFWYRITVPNGHEWYTVDAVHGVREPLFDHQRLAIELTIKTGVEYTMQTLPLVDSATHFAVKYDGSNAYIPVGAMALEFVLWDELWRCDLQTKWNWNLVPPTDYQCASRGPLPVGGAPAPPNASAPRVSPDGRWQAFLQDGQVAVRPAGGGAAIVFSSDGTADFPYQPGSIYWSDDSKTITAYRVRPELWLRHDGSSNVKTHIARGDWTVPE